MCCVPRLALVGLTRILGHCSLVSDDFALSSQSACYEVLKKSADIMTIMHTIREVRKLWKSSERRAQVHWPLSSCSHCCTVLSSTRESGVNLFQICQRNTCNYVLSLVYLGIMRVNSVLRIASLGIHVVAGNHVSFQGAFVCRGYRPHISAQALRVAEGRSCLYPYDSRGHVYQGQIISLMSSHDINRRWDDTSVNYLALGICALFQGKTDRCILVIHAPIHAVSSRFSV
jgi:hypothetical protein